MKCHWDREWFITGFIFIHVWFWDTEKYFHYPDLKDVLITSQTASNSLFPALKRRHLPSFKLPPPLSAYHIASIKFKRMILLQGQQVPLWAIVVIWNQSRLKELEIRDVLYIRATFLFFIFFRASKNSCPCVGVT